MRLEPPSWWYSDVVPLPALGLWPIAAAYGAIVERRLKRASPYASALPVLCIGNFTMGGAGKTPMALKVASMLREAGHKPGFLTRGFGGSERGPHLIDIGRDRADRVGDEPLLLAKAAPTMLSRDRPLGAKALETLGLDAIIMDDGFQNPSLRKDFSLVVVDGGAGVGNGHVFPLGPLRGRLRFQLSKADAVVILGEDRRHVRALMQKASGTLGQLPVLGAKIAPVVPDDWRDGPCLAFCGIGRPAKFFDTLREAGIAVQKSVAFPDHHAFTEADALSLLSDAESRKLRLVTTEKDRARLRGADGACGSLHDASAALPIAVAFIEDGEAKLRANLDTALVPVEGPVGEERVKIGFVS